jgi:hypothetical protein
MVSVEEMLLGVELIRNPTRFKVVKGVIEGLTLKEISSKYGIKYKYLSRLCLDMSRKGLFMRSKLFKNVVYIPTPKVFGAFKYACKELYARVLRLEGSERVKFLNMYGFTYEELVEQVKEVWIS